MPARTIGWSSATTTRITASLRDGGLLRCGREARFGSGRDRRFDRGAGPRLSTSRRRSRPPGRVGRAARAGRARRSVRRRRSRRVVRDTQDDAPAVHVQCDARRGGPSVCADVRQCLLSDAEQDHLRVAVEAGSPARRPRRDACLAGEAFAEPVQRSTQAVAGDPRGAGRDQGPRFLERGPGGLLEHGEALVEPVGPVAARSARARSVSMTMRRGPAPRCRGSRGPGVPVRS